MLFHIFSHILPVFFCGALLYVCSHLEFEFWFKKKKAKGAGWLLLISLQGLFLLFFSVKCLFTFNLLILRSLIHAWQYFEEWGEYRIRKMFSVKCHGEMACYLVYLSPLWIFNIIFCPCGESSFPFLASADLNCSRTMTWSLSWFAPREKCGRCCCVVSSSVPAWQECL